MLDQRMIGTRRVAGTASTALVLAVLVGACGGSDRSLGDALQDLPQDTTATAQPDVIPPAEPLALDTTPPLGTAPPQDGLEPGPPQDAIPWVPETEPLAPQPDTAATTPPAAAEWTARASRRRGAGGVATVAAVRSAPNAGFDRVVFEFAGNRPPGYLVEYVDRPVRECGSGNAVQLGGQGWLRVRLEPARMHTDAGAATVADRNRSPGLTVLRELRSVCDFEAQVEWVLAVASPNRYRVLELTDPTRIVVDVMHP